jgi:FkbM family methyltransferase
MNLFRFTRKCITDPPAACRSAGLVLRLLRSSLYWKLYPKHALRWRIPTGGILFLPPRHSFTSCIWPAYSSYEPEVQGILTNVIKPGHTFIDCGSNIGFFSVLAGDIVGRSGTILSIEANPLTLSFLARNLSANKLPPPIHCALNDVPGEMDLYVPSSGADIFSSLKHGGLIGAFDHTTYKVPARTLDSIVSEAALSRVDLIKIDVEGAEMNVLRSAVNTLEKFRPYCVIEYGVNTWPTFGSTPDMLLDFAKSLNYRVYRLDPPPTQTRPITAEDWSSVYSNLLLSPIERSTPWVAGEQHPKPTSIRS